MMKKASSTTVANHPHHEKRLDSSNLMRKENGGPQPRSPAPQQLALTAASREAQKHRFHENFL
jgi:hypothetical protein